MFTSIVILVICLHPHYTYLRHNAISFVKIEVYSLSYDGETTRVVLKLKRVRLFRELQETYQYSGLSAKCLWRGYGVLYKRSSCILMRWPYGHDLGPSGLGDLGQQCGLAPYEY